MRAMAADASDSIVFVVSPKLLDARDLRIRGGCRNIKVAWVRGGPRLAYRGPLLCRRERFYPNPHEDPMSQGRFVQSPSSFNIRKSQVWGQTRPRARLDAPCRRERLSSKSECWEADSGRALGDHFPPGTLRRIFFPTLVLLPRAISFAGPCLRSASKGVAQARTSERTSSRVAGHDILS